MISLGLVLIISYLVGSIPTSLIISKITHGIDIREHGSGNAGGTNVIRVLGLRNGVIVILFDIFKGYAATMFIAPLMFSPIPFNNYTPFDDITVVRILAGCAAIIGHIWTLFAGFRGGKGIATASGVLIALAPVEVLVSLGVFIIVFISSRYISLGSISAAIAFPLSMFFRHNVFNIELDGYNTLIFFSIGISILLIYTHRANIKRLLSGQEHRLSKVSFVKKKISE